MDASSTRKAVACRVSQMKSWTLDALGKLVNDLVSSSKHDKACAI